MKLNALTCAAVALTIGALPASAKSFRAINTLTVNPINATEFEVIKKPGASPRAIWCAAADYSGRRLGHYTKTDLFIVSPIGPSKTEPRRNGVVFTIDPNQLSVEPSKSDPNSVKTAGASMGVVQAKGPCRTDISPFDSR